jgi:hypothetical protein
MHDSSTAGPQRPRVRKGLGMAVGVAMCLTPLAMAPAASAQAATGGPLGGFDTLLAGIAAGVTGGNTLGNPLGGGAVPQANCYTPDGLGSTLSCVVVPVKNAIKPGPGSKASSKAKAKARRIHR